MNYVSPPSPFRSICLGLAMGCSAALPSVAPATAQEATSGVRFQPEVGVSYALPSDLSEGTLRRGDLSSLQTRVSLPFRFGSRDRLSWSAGLDWQRFSFGVPGGSPLPNTLQSISLPVGMNWKWNDRWRALLDVRPGLYSDFEDIGSDDVNVPATIGLVWSVNPRLQLVGQLSLDVKRDTPVIGGVGVIWAFAERWTLSLLIPRPRIEYRPTEHLTWFAGAALSGGSFRVAKDFGTTHGRPALNNEDVDYSEIRAGGGVLYDLGRRVKVELEGGWMIDRRFHFHEQDLLLNGDGAPYVSAAFNFSF